MKPGTGAACTAALCLIAVLLCLLTATDLALQRRPIFTASLVFWALVDNLSHGLVAFLSWAACEAVAQALMTPFESHSPDKHGAAGLVSSLLTMLVVAAQHPCRLLKQLGASVASGSQDTTSALLRCIVAGALASSIDLDHFTHGLSMKKALGWRHRPAMHHTLLALAVVFLELRLVGLLSRRRSAKILRATTAAKLGSVTPGFKNVQAVLMAMTIVLSHHLRDAFRRGLSLWPVSNDQVSVSYTAYLVVEAVLPVAVGVMLSAGRRYLFADVTSQQQQVTFHVDVV